MIKHKRGFYSTTESVEVPNIAMISDDDRASDIFTLPPANHTSRYL